ASLTSMISVVMRDSSLPISSGNVVWSAGSRPCRWCLFMSDVILFCAARAVGMESPYALHNKAQISSAADACAHGCITRGCLRDQFVAATRRQPGQGADVLGRQADTIRNLVGTVLVILAGAQAGIEQLAGNMGEVDFPGILVLELFQAAARAAVAQALSFGAGHFLQRLC